MHSKNKSKTDVLLLRCCLRLQLNGLVVLAGDNGCSQFAYLAEYFARRGSQCAVVAVPKTIDGDLKVPNCFGVPLGFDTATRTYAEMVGNLMVDALSSQKYYHFVRLMGRSASHVALEVALQVNEICACVRSCICASALSV